MTPKERHDDVVRRYPAGLTPAQFKHEALASADADGLIDPPAIADWFVQKSLLISMWMEGVIELHGSGRDKPMGPWYITKKGIAIKSQAPEAAAMSAPTGQEKS